MAKSLPARPNLDHLRQQAKALLAALATREPAAIETFRRHLPAATNLAPGEITPARFRLADAQAALARQNGFAGWPHLARHVEQLRALEGTWAFERLEIDGMTMPPAGLASSRILIDGDRFRTESPEATYEGIFNIDVEAEPQGIDLDFVAGPEAGRTNRGIFRFTGDRLEICLDLNGKPRPKEFRTAAGRGHAHEVLRRVSVARPAAVDGGTPPPPPLAVATPPATEDLAAFAYAETPLLVWLQGDWSPVEVVIDGGPLPKMMLTMGSRRATKNELTVAFGGRTMIHALVRLDESVTPVTVDYLLLDGEAQGVIQRGILQREGDIASFCMAPPGQPRPADFTSPRGSGRTLSRWRKKK